MIARDVGPSEYLRPGQPSGGLLRLFHVPRSRPDATCKGWDVRWRLYRYQSQHTFATSMSATARKGGPLRPVHAMRPRNGFPYVRSRFCVFAQLTHGLGKIPFRIDIRSAENDELVWATETRKLTFETRHSLVQVAMYIEGCRFERPGVYLVELFCDNIWVSDTELLLR